MIFCVMPQIEVAIFIIFLIGRASCNTPVYFPEAFYAVIYPSHIVGEDKNIFIRADGNDNTSCDKRMYDYEYTASGV